MWQKIKRNLGGKTNLVPRDERGAVLLVVTLILALMSVLILSWGREWRLELTLAANFLEVRKSRRLAEAGVYYSLGKLARVRRVEAAAVQGNRIIQSNVSDQDILRLDNQPRILKFPAGEVEVRVADEGGKINLNQAKEEILLRLFMVLGIPEIKTRTMVDSIIDWRTRGDQPQPYGAKSSYYLRLEPPYVSKNGRFETVEELAWVRGFENSSIIPILTDFLTVQATGQAINVNTAPPQVLRAVGLSDDNVAAIVMARQQKSLQNLQEMGSLQLDPWLGQRQPFSFASSLFFTIKSKGTVINGKGSYTTKAIVRLQPNQSSPWSFVSWMDDFPG